MNRDSLLRDAQQCIKIKLNSNPLLVLKLSSTGTTSTDHE